MNKYDIVKRIEAFAPLETQESWDASGWLVCTEKDEVNKVLFCLTVTDKIIEQAFALGCDMVISHHPLFMVKTQYKYINIYSAHTNLDKAEGGTTDLILNKLGLKGSKYGDYVRIVELEEELGVSALKDMLMVFSPCLRIVNNNQVETVKTIGFCAGSGSEFMVETPCDAFVTGDLKFHTAVEADKVIFDIGHFESEIFAPKLLKEISGVGENGIIADETSPFI